jgi:hypothetical protein
MLLVRKLPIYLKDDREVRRGDISHEFHEKICVLMR